MSDTAVISSIWIAFLESRPDLPANLDYYEAFTFGSRPESATALAKLVLAGTKTATSEAMGVYDESGQRPPRTGDYSIVLDGSGVPRCVIETLEIVVAPFNEVDDAFAYDYGEGDRTLAWWQDAMWEYYEQECASRGWPVSQDLPLMCERFQVVFVPAVRRGADEA